MLLINIVGKCTISQCILNCQIVPCFSEIYEYLITRQVNLISGLRIRCLFQALLHILYKVEISLFLDSRIIDAPRNRKACIIINPNFCTDASCCRLCTPVHLHGQEEVKPDVTFLLYIGLVGQKNRVAFCCIMRFGNEILSLSDFKILCRRSGKGSRHIDAAGISNLYLCITRNSKLHLNAELPVIAKSRTVIRGCPLLIRITCTDWVKQYHFTAFRSHCFKRGKRQILLCTCLLHSFFFRLRLCCPNIFFRWNAAVFR